MQRPRKRSFLVYRQETSPKLMKNTVVSPLALIVTWKENLDRLVRTSILTDDRSRFPEGDSFREGPVSCGRFPHLPYEVVSVARSLGNPEDTHGTPSFPTVEAMRTILVGGQRSRRRAGVLQGRHYGGGARRPPTGNVFLWLICPWDTQAQGSQLRNAREPCFARYCGACASVYRGVYAARCNMFSGCVAQFQKELGGRVMSRLNS